jgi:hypothetical protein
VQSSSAPTAKSVGAPTAQSVGEVTRIFPDDDALREASSPAPAVPAPAARAREHAGPEDRPQRTGRRLRALPIIGMVALMIAVGLTWWTLQPDTSPGVKTPAPKLPEVKAPVPKPPEVKAPVPKPLEAKALPPNPSEVKAPVPKPPEVKAPPLTPAAALDAVASVRDPGWSVYAAADLTQIRIGQDKLKFKIASSRPGYVYIFMLGTDAQHVYQLFPNSLDRQNKVTADRAMDLPRAGWAVLAAGPPGTDRILVMVSAAPREFPGLRPGNPFGELEIPSLQSRFAQDGGRAVAGTAHCAPDTPAPCDSFGAAKLLIEEVDGVDSRGRERPGPN